MRGGRSTIGLVEVTAADRAAATLRRGGLSSVMRVAHDSSFCGRSQGGRVCGRRRGFRLCGGEAGAFRSPPPPLRPPTYKLVSNETLAGRGGSVSRRDLNRHARKRTHLSGGTKLEEVRNPNANRSSGGSAREGLLSEKPPPSQPLVRIPLVPLRRGPGGGASL